MRILSGTYVLALGLLTVLPVQAQNYTVNGTSTAVKAEFSITSLSNKSVTFTFKNVSPIKSQLAGIGFDVKSGTFEQTGGPTTPFTFVNGHDQVPQFNSVKLDFFLATNGDFNGGGDPKPGLSVGETSSAYTIFSKTGFAGLSADDLANGIYFRFKAIGENGNGSDVAHRLSPPPSVVAAVPEPSEYAFGGIFLTGLMGLMVRARRKRAIPTA